MRLPSYYAPASHDASACATRAAHERNLGVWYAVCGARGTVGSVSPHAAPCRRIRIHILLLCCSIKADKFSQKHTKQQKKRRAVGGEGGGGVNWSRRESSSFVLAISTHQRISSSRRHQSSSGRPLELVGDVEPVVEPVEVRPRRSHAPLRR